MACPALAPRASRRRLRRLSSVARFHCVRVANRFARNGTPGFLSLSMARNESLRPHCLERVHMERAVGASPKRCPACGRAVGLAGQREVASPDYAMNAGKESRPEAKEIQEYVHGLERRARRDRKVKPYQRRAFPVNLVAGMLLLNCGLALLGKAFTVSEGLMSSLVNGIFPAFILILCGAMCLVFWSKK